MQMSQIIDLWENVLAEIKPGLTRLVFDTWIKTLIPLKITDNEFIIGAPKSFVKEWVQEHYHAKISDAVAKASGKKLTVIIKNLDLNEEENTPLKTSLPKPKETKQNIIPAFSTEQLDSSLNKKYTFENFVIGNSNRFSHAASLAVTEAPGKVYNPLFIYGGVGLGKTHLMHAIGHKIKENNPDSKVLYISSENFTNELINTLRAGNMEKFRQKYRTIDCILIDDIQFLAKKERTQEEFFHTFNTLYDANKQIVISSDRPPKEIPTLEERLRSRFEWGLTTDVQPPDVETRIAILKNRAAHDNTEIPNDVIVFIASKIENNIRELEGALLRVIAYSSLNKSPVTMDTAVQALKNIINVSFKKPITIEKIQDIVANYYKIKKEDLLAKKRTKNIVYPRQISMYLCRELTDYSLPKIGELFNRDHTTVIHSIEKISNEIKKDENLKNEIEFLTQKLKS